MKLNLDSTILDIENGAVTNIHHIQINARLNFDLNFIQLKRDVGLNMHHDPINVLLAQWIARRTSNPEVAGSSPV